MRRELRAMLGLSLPVILAELGWVMMGVVDTIIVSPLGPAAIGAVGSGSTMFFAVFVLGMGTLYALDTFVAQAYGAGRLDECHRWCIDGLYVAAVLSVLLIVLGMGGVTLLGHAGIHPAVLVLLQPYLSALLWSVPPLLAYTVFRRYLQAMNSVLPITIAFVSANVVNALGNYALIFGHFGLPAFGVIGSAYATGAARVFLALFLLAAILFRERRNPSGFHDVPWTIDLTRMWRIVRLGVPAALQITMEVGVFAAASMLAGRISPMALAGHQIVLHVASVLFMIPYGLSSAAAVRVGHAVGRHDRHGLRVAGWAAVTIAIVFAGVMSALLVIMPRVFLGLFTADTAVLTVGATLLLIYAIGQPFDALQVVATGALRGVGNTRTPMLANLIGHWGIGLPIAYYLCFSRNWGVEGLWVGLMVGLGIIGAYLTDVWRRAATKP
jgi:MATE family multidrug resistance protein